MKKKNRVGTVFIYLIFIMLCLCILYPFLCVLSVSLSSAEDIKLYGFRVLPKHLDFSAYSYLFRDSKMLWQATAPRFLSASSERLSAVWSRACMPMRFRARPSAGAVCCHCS